MAAVALKEPPAKRSRTAAAAPGAGPSASAAAADGAGDAADPSGSEEVEEDEIDYEPEIVEDDRKSVEVMLLARTFLAQMKGLKLKRLVAMRERSTMSWR